MYINKPEQFHYATMQNQFENSLHSYTSLGEVLSNNPLFSFARIISNTYLALTSDSRLYRDCTGLGVAKAVNH